MVFSSGNQVEQHHVLGAETGREDRGAMLGHRASEHLARGIGALLQALRQRLAHDTSCDAPTRRRLNSGTGRSTEVW